MTVSRMPQEAETPKGLRPGDSPAGIAWPKSLWVVLPAQPSESQHESLMRLRLTLREHEDLLVAEAKVQERKGHGGFTYSLMRASDIAGLYYRAHRARTAVIALCGASVLLDISEQPSNRGCMSLQRFVRYKCFYSLLSRPQEVEKVWADAMSWMAATHCDGPRDPRCFPASIFETQHGYVLDTDRKRKDFINQHRLSKGNTDLVDDRGRVWHIGPAHTLDLIQVGGFTLPIGFHWDVQAKHDTVIATGWDRWELPGRGYTNVHPDALVRDGNATRTHSSRSERTRRSVPRTPRATRQGKNKKHK
jgi:hypothetical protein